MSSRTLQYLTITLTFLIPSLACADIDPVTELTCEGTDGNSYPWSLSWTNQDPDDEYSEHRIFRNGELIATLVGGDAESYLDRGVTGGGRFAFVVEAYSETGDCTAVPDEECVVFTGLNRVCAASEDGWEAIEIEAGDSIESSFEWENEDLAAIDGGSECDLSPDEDGRVDIAYLMVLLSFETPAVDTFEWILTSPEGTTLTLWDLNGDSVTWGDDGSVLLSDHGDEIPDRLPDDCTIETCLYIPAGPGTLEDFIGDDASGSWTLDGSTTDEGTLHDWCIYFSVDEFREPGVSYIRGDVDGNLVITPLVDALRLLLHFFEDPDLYELPCLESADTDGNGVVSAIIDALRLLQWAFGDADFPPAPFPNCGRPDPGYNYTGPGEPCFDPPCVPPRG